jgi:hypothetical protein
MASDVVVKDVAPRLAPWLFADEAARKEPQPIGGPLGWLPPDLINHVVACLLRLPQHPHVSLQTTVCAELGAYGVKAFARTCKGVRGSISCAHVAEVIAREAWVPIVPPRSVRMPYPYRDLVLSQARCRIIFNVVRRAAHTLLLTASGLKGSRDCFNNLMKSSAPDARTQTLSRAAMGDATHARVSLVAERDAFLLCTTPNGVAVHQGGRIFCTGPNPSEVFVPGMEMATTFSVPAPRDGRTYWAAWHVESQRLTVCSCDLGICKYNYRRAPRERWGEHRGAEMLDYTLTTWDTVHNRVVDERVVHSVTDWPWPLGFLLKVWACGDTVWMAFVATDVHPNRQEVTFEVTLVHYVPGKSDEATLVRLPPFLNSIQGLSVSEESGHVAILSRAYHAGDGRHKGVLHFYDVQRRRMVTVDGTDRHSSRDAVLVSPSGASMVLLCCAMPWLEVTVYTRETENEGMLGWTKSKRSPLSEISHGMTHEATNLVAEAFSPCGSRALFLFHSWLDLDASGILVVDLVKTEHSHQVETEWHDWHADHIPSQVAWSEDGFFVRSAQDGGVLRVGLAA